MAELQSPAGVYAELEPERFISDYAAVIPAGQQPETAGVVIESEDSEDAPAYDGPTLMESTLPLRTEGPGGKEEAVDLHLERVGGELKPATPLVEVAIPGELGKGISLPEAGVTVELLGAPRGRAPSIIEGTAAAYPEVAQDTSLAVAPTAAGVETLTMLQSADSPREESFRLGLPAGAELKATADGGAEAVKANGDPLLNISPPNAIDANGATVPVSLEVAGDTFKLAVSPGAEAAFPILVDPVVQQVYNWAENGGTVNADWSKFSTGAGYDIGTSYPFYYGPHVIAYQGTSIAHWAEGGWSYEVPRRAADMKALGHAPKSFVSEMKLSDLYFAAGEYSVNPILYAGLKDELKNSFPSLFVHWGIQGDLTNTSTTYTLTNTDHEVKEAIALELSEGEAHTMSAGTRVAYVGSATVSVADEDLPRLGVPSAPPTWVNKTALAPISVPVTDEGLGVKSTKFEIPGQGTKVVTESCTGLVANPCPAQSTPSVTTAQYNPAEMPQGIDGIPIVSEDVVGNKSAQGKAFVYVDHTAPELTLSGTATEQATLGTKNPTYTIKAKATDGVAGAPQSGIYKAKIEIDGTQVAIKEPKCATENCTAEPGYTIEASKYSTGQHTIKVTAEDTVGLTTTKELKITLNATPPSITLSGPRVQRHPSAIRVLRVVRGWCGGVLPLLSVRSAAIRWRLLRSDGRGSRERSGFRRPRTLRRK